ncbi:MAG: Tex family protein [Thermoanaerobaculia bacterium]
MATPDALEARFVEIIARDVGCRPAQVVAAARLFAEKATVPFVARYRKEVTGGLIDEQLETIFKQRRYFLELAERRRTILESVDAQGKLTAELEASIRAATAKQELEDLYLPYRPRRRTRAQIAREKGLEPLADRLLAKAGSHAAPDGLARSFVDPGRGVADVEEALAGARDILAERLAEDARNRDRLRRTLRSRGELRVRVKKGKAEAGQIYRDYFDHHEPAARIRSHRLLAIQRGEREGFLSAEVAIDDGAETRRAAGAWRVPLQSPCGRQVEAASADGYKRLLRPSLTKEIRAELRQRAETEAIAVFRANLEALLMQAPFGQVPVLGLDPGYRTGCKMAVVDRTGRVTATGVLYPLDRARQAAAAGRLRAAITSNSVHAVAIGNGTGGRETEIFARQVVREAGLEGVLVAIVPETGASVYSASAVARDELPDLDVALRGAVSIARRLQDPLAELVKIDPKSLGVGQYQHDVDQKALAGELDLAVEGVVNNVGVELNTASPQLLARVSGLAEKLARAIVAHRDQHGPYRRRRALLEVAGFGPRAFELAAGFLRITGGDEPLDRTAVHPERYGVVRRMARQLGAGVGELIGHPELVGSIDFDRFADAGKDLGRFTLADIRRELESPGRDPRPEFEAPAWREDVQSLDDLEPGMVLEGRVSNVTNFGAFVDVGVKRDGLVHVSELSRNWVDDPRQVVQVGQVVEVQVLEIDRDRGRVALSIKALQ